MHPDGGETNSMTSFQEVEIPISGSVGGNENIVTLIRKPTLENMTLSPGVQQAHAWLPGPVDGDVAQQMQQGHLQTRNWLPAQPLIHRRHRRCCEPLKGEVALRGAEVEIRMMKCFRKKKSDEKERKELSRMSLLLQSNTYTVTSGKPLSHLSQEQIVCDK